MDWTGGSKRRFAVHGKQGMLQRQRAHFAKARSAVQKFTGSQRSPRRDEALKRRGHGSPASRYEKKRKVPSLDYKHHTYGQTTSIPATRLNAAQSSLRRVGEKLTRNDSRNLHGSKRTWTSTSVDAVRSAKSQRRSCGDVRNSSSCANKLSTNGARHQTPTHEAVCNKTSHAKQEPLIITSSNSSAESPLSEISSAPLRKEGRNTAGEAKTLPLTERQRLLARPDWLGLEATRPLQIHFQPNEDKSHIGKRRKLERSSRKESTRTRHHNAISNIHHSYLRDAWDHQTSDPPDILVKIGTEALSSQGRTHNTAPHQQTQPTSIRPMSVESQSLSEESMLLEAGEDPPMFTNFDPGASMADRLGPLLTQPQYVLASSCFSSLSGSNEAIDYDDELFRVSDSHNSAAARHNGEFLGNGLSESHLGGSVSASETGSIKQKETDATACEQGWRAHLGVQACSLSKESMMVLRSSEGCTTSPDRVRRTPVSRNIIAALENLGHVAPTEMHGASHSRTWQDPASNEAVASLTSSPTGRPSPSASLALIRKLAQVPTTKRSSLQKVQDDDAIWRGFIIGSQSSDS